MWKYRCGPPDPAPPEGATMTSALTPTSPDTRKPAPARYVPEHDKTGTGHEDYAQVLDDLSAASVQRNFDPYIAIDWDAQDLAIIDNAPRRVVSTEVEPNRRHPCYNQPPQAKQNKKDM